MAAIDGPAGPSIATKSDVDGPAADQLRRGTMQLRRDRTEHLNMYAQNLLQASSVLIQKTKPSGFIT